MPILHGNDVIGEIDIDSDEPAAFDAGDQTFLEHVADAVSARARA